MSVTTASGVPAGTVQVYKGSKLLDRHPDERHRHHQGVEEGGGEDATFGKVTLTAKYLGSATVAASQADFVVKVKKKK